MILKQNKEKLQSKSNLFQNRNLFSKKINNFIQVDGNYFQLKQKTQKEKKRKLLNVQTMEIGNENNIHEVIQQAVNSTDLSPIVVINNQPVITKQNITEKDNEEDYIYNMQKINSMDLNNLSNVLTNIDNIYSDYYKKLPQQLRDNNKDFSIDKQQNYEAFVLSLRAFSRDVISSSEFLMNNINYFERKIHLMQSGEEEMMNFFNFQQRYSRLKVETNTMDDDKLKLLWNQISEITRDYNGQIQLSSKYSYDLYKFNLDFANHIKYLGMEKGHDLQDSLHQFDQILHFNVKLVEEKSKIQKSISKLEKILQELQVIHYEIDSKLYKISQRRDEIKNELKDKKDEIKLHNEKKETAKSTPLQKPKSSVNLIITTIILSLIQLFIN